MSQVKKFQVGGKFRMNGREISGQRALDNLAAAYAGSDPSERGMWNVAQRAIQDGYTAQYNNGDNSIQVFDVDGNDVTSKYTDTKASTTDKGIKRFFDSIGENESHRFKKSGRMKMEITYILMALIMKPKWILYVVLEHILTMQIQRL